jgi:hypothetical protein
MVAFIGTFYSSIGRGREDTHGSVCDWARYHVQSRTMIGMTRACLCFSRLSTWLVTSQSNSVWSAANRSVAGLAAEAIDNGLLAPKGRLGDHARERRAAVPAWVIG